MQKSVAISSCEAEYMTLKKAAKKLIWLKALFKQLKSLNSIFADTLYCNNKSAIDLSKNPKYYARTKYIDIQYHFIRDYIKKEIFKLKYINCYDPSYAHILVAMLVAMLVTMLMAMFMTIAGRSSLGYRIVPEPTLFRVSLCSSESYR